MCSARRPSTRRRGSAGFSILEALAATTVLAVGLAGFAASTVSITRTQKAADSTSAAHALAQQKLEQLRSTPLGAPQLLPGNYTDASNPLKADGTTGGSYARTWTVSPNDTPSFGLRTVTVTVGWSDARAHTTTLAAYVRCSNSPC